MDEAIPWESLSDDQREVITRRVHDFMGNGSDPVEHWAAMGASAQREWVSNYIHPIAPGDGETWDDYWKRVQSRVDPDTQAAYELLTQDLADLELAKRHLTPDAVKALPDPEWVLDGWLVRNTLSLLWGDWNAGKSFLALTWAGFLGSGSWWLGREVRKVKVLYVAGEGVAGLGPRIRAFEMHHRLYGMPGVGFIHGRVNLLDAQQMSALERLCEHEHYELIVWDTLARMLPGLDENSSREMSLMVDALDRLRDEVGCGSLALHHGTKEGSTARGISPYLGACDTELKLVADEEAMTLECRQQRDGNRPEPVKLWRESVQGTGSATVVDGIGRVLAASNATEQAIAAVLRSAPGSPFTMNQITSSAGCPRTSGQRGLDSLIKQGLVAKGAHGITKTYTWTTREFV